MKANSKLQMYTLSDVENLKIHGRTTGHLAPLTLFWTGSAVRSVPPMTFETGHCANRY
ncbi:hypothetical protein ACFTRD_21065 [Paenibacillus sp. NPDC056933]|uniref:hypothetical protein n=1 Tax=Paenibacillus sp. NPDC056933 TaxID=3345968 RepID=UPI00362719DD